jgi:hypothetical protein
MDSAPAVSTRPGDLKGRTTARGGQGGVSGVVRLAYVKVADLPSLPAQPSPCCCYQLPWAS